MLTTQPCCSIEFIESFLFWFILVTCNIRICFVYIFKVSYIHSFFIIFNCNVFSSLHAKHFEIRKNILWNWWVDCYSTIHQVMSYFWVFIVNPVSLLWSIFLFSRKLCFLWSLYLLLIAGSISIDTSGKPTMGFFLKITCSLLSISIDELNWIDWLFKNWWWIFLK